jgi:hypothetical protein
MANGKQKYDKNISLDISVIELNREGFNEPVLSSSHIGIINEPINNGELNLSRLFSDPSLVWDDDKKQKLITAIQTIVNKRYLEQNPKNYTLGSDYDKLAGEIGKTSKMIDGVLYDDKIWMSDVIKQLKDLFSRLKPCGEHTNDIVNIFKQDLNDLINNADRFDCKDLKEKYLELLKKVRVNYDTNITTEVQPVVDNLTEISNKLKLGDVGVSQLPRLGGASIRRKPHRHSHRRRTRKIHRKKSRHPNRSSRR